MGNPYTPHTARETERMLEVVGVETEEELFDIPDAVTFDEELDIPGRSEQEIRQECADTLGDNADLVEFLGRGHYGHYVPSVVDDLSSRSEFLTSYTQYQPEIAQGFLQALFEYQSMFVELTGLEIVNCSMYDAATALGEAATLAARVRETSGDTILIPEETLPGRASVLDNYVEGAGMDIETFPLADGTVDLTGLEASITADCAMIYIENPSTYGTIEAHTRDIGHLAHDNDAILTVGSDPVALAVLEPPATQGADVVIGDAATLGLPMSFGTGLGLFATREDFLRQLPGRIVGATEDADGRRTYTLTLQTREQHIRRERATSNICTNQAWVALRTAMHVSWLGPDGLVETASDCIELATDLASRLDAIEGIEAPVHDGHHFREFVARSDRPAPKLADEIEEHGYAVHVVDEDHIQVAVTEVTATAVDGFVDAVREVMA